jgi:O-antigen ligase
LTFRYIGLGTALIPLVGVTIPWSLGTGTQSQLVAAFLFSAFLLGAWLTRALLRRDLHIPNSPIVVPTVCLACVWLLALVVSDVVQDPTVRFPSTWTLIQLGGLSVVVVPCGVLLLALHAGMNTRWIRWATWSFIGVGVVGVAFFYLTPGRGTGPLQTGGLFTMWIVALAYGQALFNDKLAPWVRAALVLLSGAWIVKALVLETWWFSGWLPSLVVLAALTLFRSRRAFVALLGPVGLAVIVNWQTVYDVVWGTTVRKGDLNRFDIWSQTLDLVKHYPILGTGPAGYAAYFMNLYAGSSFSMSTHNNYFDVLAETGVVGCLVFAWFLIALLCIGWRACRNWRSGFLGGYAHAGMAGLIGVSVAMFQGDWLIPFVYNQTIVGYRYTIHSWVFFGFLASLALLKPRAEDNS